MPTNKHAIIRYRTIDRCLRERDGQWNWQSLAEECAKEIQIATSQGVSLSERTIKGDLADMRNNEILGYYAPIEYDRKEKSYYYTDAQYAISETPINKADKSSLQEAIDILKQFGGLSEVLGIQSIITKLQHSIDYRVGKTSSSIHFDHPLDAPGQEWLYTLYKFISDEIAVKLLYHAFGRTKKSYIISPYLLKEYNKRWYLIAYHHDTQSIRTFALDRIEDVSDSLSEFVRAENFNGNLYFNDVVGVTVDAAKKKEIIQFKAFGVQVNYFKTRPLHKSQVIIKEEKDWTLFQIELIVNYEIVSELFSYRNNVQVVSPPELVDQVRQEIESMYKRYTQD